MLELTFGRRRSLQVLCLGAHCDDIEIGCGGTLLALLATYPSVSVTWVAFSASPARERELRASAGRFLRGARRARVLTHDFRDGFFPAEFAGVKETFEALKRLPRPDVIFTHDRADRHQDHRIVGDLTWNTFRSHLILEYEVPKYDGGLTTPSAYVGLTAGQVARKIRILKECYVSQRGKSWFSEATFRGLMRLRGIEAAAASGWAEGFHATKYLLA
jgi:LmbE family N-acetylglucosaminyl deacetylase